MNDVVVSEYPVTLAGTPPQILGPFYPFMHKPSESGDLTGGGQAKGAMVYLSGRVLAVSGEPVAGARVEIWQANGLGRYDHPNDDSELPLDEHFHGFAVAMTDADGCYQFKTIRPAAYQAAPGRWRPAHIHFCVTSKVERLVTQMYFRGEQYNDTDPWLNSAQRKESLITDPVPAQQREPGAIAITFNIVLMKG
jgi:protocatechuate 3,4-dioxygenase beta subunit